MATLQLNQLWNNHPYPESPCDSSLANQCAIRMGVALERSGVRVTGVRRCWFKHKPGHILAAQELANALLKVPECVGAVEKFKPPVTTRQFVGRSGIVFIVDGWGPSDHIDVWNGFRLKGGDSTYFTRGKEVWFWPL